MSRSIPRAKCRRARCNICQTVGMKVSDQKRADQADYGAEEHLSLRDECLCEWCTLDDLDYTEEQHLEWLAYRAGQAYCPNGYDGHTFDLTEDGDYVCECGYIC